MNGFILSHSKSSTLTLPKYFNARTIKVEDAICTNETTDGSGKCSNANLFDSSKVELHNEYATIATSFSEYDEPSPLATILLRYSRGSLSTEFTHHNVMVAKFCFLQIGRGTGTREQASNYVMEMVIANYIKMEY